MIKAYYHHSAMEVIKRERLKRRAFSVEFKAGVLRYKKAENLSLPECGRKFEVLPKLIRDWEKQYDAGQITVASGRRAVSQEQAEITRLRAKLSRSWMGVNILKKAAAYFAGESL